MQETLDAGDTGVGAVARLEGVELGTLGGDLEDRSEALAPWVPSLVVGAARGDQGQEELPGADGLEA